MRFQYIEFMWLLWIIPFIILTYILLNTWRRKRLKEWGDKKLTDQLTKTISRPKRNLKIVLFSLGLCSLILALCNLQFGSKSEEVKKQGIDIVVALDVSNSMTAEDLTPNRLEAAKRSISQLIDKLRSDRIGIVLFAGQSYVQLPITTDYAAAKLFTGTIDTKIIPTQGTAIGDAIETSIGCFDPESPTKKAIIVITDGENHEDNAVSAAEKAKEAGINVYCIGIGSENGAPIPIYQNGIQQGFRKAPDGSTIMTKLNEQMLLEIALAGNGTYIRSTNAGTGIKDIMNELDKLEKTEFGSTVFTDYEDRFQIFLIIALLLFVTDALISERRNFRFSSIDLFGEKK